MTTCPGCGLDFEIPDGRIVKWRARFRLYNMKRPDEPMADSDPDRHPGQSGAGVFDGLPAVAGELIYLATHYHNFPALLRGLDATTLAHSLKGFRPTLSRRKGSGSWRVKYDTPETFKNNPDHVPGWLARVDIERIDHENP